MNPSTPGGTASARAGGAALGGRSVTASGRRRRLFNAFELRLFRYTAVLASLVALAALMGVVVWTLVRIVQVYYNLLLPLALAGVLALVLHPVVEFLVERLRLPRLLAVSLLLVAFVVAVGGMLLLIVPTLVSQVIQLMTVLPQTLAGWQEHFSLRFPELSEMISARLENDEGGAASPELPGMPALEEPGKRLMSYLGLLAGLGFVPLYLFFTLLSGNVLRSQASELLSVFRRRTQLKVLYFMDVFVGYVSAFFQGQLIIAASMGALYALGFTLIGLKFGVLAGLVLGLLNIVPFLGTLIGMLVILPMAFLQPGGGVQLLVLTALAFAVVQLVESWLLTPRIMANRSGLHPALVVISLFFWGTALGGIIGMVLAVPLTAFFVAIWSEIKASLVHALDDRDAAT